MGSNAESRSEPQLHARPSLDEHVVWNFMLAPGPPWICEWFRNYGAAPRRVDKGQTSAEKDLEAVNRLIKDFLSDWSKC